ncbi:MAG: hypothetical protein R3220_07420, partial [Balneolaceae bacterium]|nr:hypothetical protein [Balneolaceae bacterium]
MQYLAKVITIIFTLIAVFGSKLLVKAQALNSADTNPQSERKQIKIPEIQNSIDLDGEVSEQEWQHARRLPLIQQKPNYGESPSEKTEILIGHTEENLYVACRCFDTYQPSA